MSRHAPAIRDAQRVERLRATEHDRHGRGGEVNHGARQPVVVSQALTAHTHTTISTEVTGVCVYARSDRPLSIETLRVGGGRSAGARGGEGSEVIEQNNLLERKSYNHRTTHTYDTHTTAHFAPLHLWARTVRSMPLSLPGPSSLAEPSRFVLPMRSVSGSQKGEG